MSTDPDWVHEKPKVKVEEVKLAAATPSSSAAPVSNSKSAPAAAGDQVPLSDHFMKSEI